MVADEHFLEVLSDPVFRNHFLFINLWMIWHYLRRALMTLLRELSFKVDHIFEVLLKYASEEEDIILIEGDTHILYFEVH